MDQEQSEIKATTQPITENRNTARTAFSSIEEGFKTIFEKTRRRLTEAVEILKEEGVKGGRKALEVLAGKRKDEGIRQNDESRSQPQSQSQPQPQETSPSNDSQKKAEEGSKENKFPQNPDESLIPEETNEKVDFKKNDSLNLPNLPETYNIQDFSRDPQPLLMHDFEFLIKNGKWDLRFEEDGFKVVITPKLNEGWIKLADGTFINPELVTGNGTSLDPNSGYNKELPTLEGRNRKMIFRGIYHDEMVDILRNGFIKSRGDAVQHIGGHENLTFFSEEIQMAADYAVRAGRVQGAYYPTPNHPNYIICIERPDEITLQGNGEVGLSGEIPLSKIITIIEVNPYMATSGEIPLERDENNNVRPMRGLNAYKKPMDIRVAYKEVDIEELRRTLISDKKMDKV